MEQVYSRKQILRCVLCRIEGTVSPVSRQRGTLATPDLNPLPAKQPGVYRPRARSEHDQAYSEGREQKVHVPSASTRKRDPNLDDCLQSSRNGCPQSGQQETSDPDSDESYVMCVRGYSPKFGAAADQQGHSCSYAQDEESSPGPTARKHRKQSLQSLPLLRRNVTLIRGKGNGIPDLPNPQMWGRF